MTQIVLARVGSAILALVALVAIGCQPSPPTALRLDISNRADVAVVVSVASDTTARMQGFLPGEQGTMTIPLGSTENGIGVEILRAIDCSYLVEGTQSFPSDASFTLIIDGGPDRGSGVLTVEQEVAGAPLGLPQNALRCSGG